jgi:hypothetical protein
MKRIAKLFLAALLAWIGGLIVISVVLYFGNSGSDFTLTDLMGFGVLFLVASTLLMMLVYLPGLFWLRRKNRKRILFPLFSGLLLNLPVFVFLAILIGRKMSASESIGFMLTFLVAGLVFGLAFARTELRKHAQSE